MMLFSLSGYMWVFSDMFDENSMDCFEYDTLFSKNIGEQQ